MYAPLPQNGPQVRVNLYSDTQTKPTAAMRAAMLDAEVGDEQLGLDPSVNALTARVAALLGKEAALLLPSGAMCNTVAILTQCRPGDEILAHESAHIIEAEGGGPWALAGARVLGLRGERGQFDAATVRAALSPRSRYTSPQTLLVVEQTSNLGGGTVWPLAALEEVTGTAREAGMATHMDGARLLNAVVASGIAAADYAALFDSVWIDFTKGLGAPLGAVLAGSAEFIGRAWQWKQRLGGSLRQVGMNAAACLYALDHHVERLAEDHARAKSFARRISQFPGLTVQMPETNLVFATVADAPAMSLALRARGVMASAMGRTRLRFCTHLDVDDAGIDIAVEALGAILNAD